MNNLERSQNNQPKGASALVSVVMPVKNASRHLGETLSSLQQQSLGRFEVICVDDGSEDDSVEIIRRFSAGDTRFKLMKNSSGGAGAARNKGLLKAEGRYVIFLDADDVFDKDLLACPFEALEKSSADLCVFEANFFDSASGTTLRTLGTRFHSGEKVYSPDDFGVNIFQIASWAPWNKMLRREFVMRNHIRFQEIPSCNDAYFSILSLAHAESIYILPKQLVGYRVNGGSTNAKIAREKRDCEIRAAKKIFDEVISFPDLTYEKRQSLCVLCLTLAMGSVKRCAFSREAMDDVLPRFAVLSRTVAKNCKPSFRRDNAFALLRTWGLCRVGSEIACEFSKDWPESGALKILRLFKLLVFAVLRPVR